MAVTDVLDGKGVRFRGSRTGRGKRVPPSPPPTTSVVENGVSSRLELERNVVEEEEEPSVVRSSPVWNFPPTLEDFDLMESDIDPSQLEDMFADDRYVRISLHCLLVCNHLESEIQWSPTTLATCQSVLIRGGGGPTTLATCQSVLIRGGVVSFQGSRLEELTVQWNLVVPNCREVSNIGNTCSNYASPSSLPAG